MSNIYIEKELQEMYNNASMREKERQRHKRNVAAIADFASNLITILGRTKGNKPHRNNNKIFKKYKTAVTDYKGTIAGDLFRTKLMSREAR